ncbi:MAG: hypothetical protein EON60_13100 [Alphaproteobacteria bacterium]|nr:MAG: hypothetical protein EON60_13100 [Alphaproteobacteria bacterium]
MSTVTSAAAIRPPPLTFNQLTITLANNLPDFIIFLLVLLPVLLFIGFIYVLALLSSVLAVLVGAGIALYVFGKSIHFLWSTRHQQSAAL